MVSELRTLEHTAGMPELAPSNCNSFPAIKQNPEGGRFKYDYQVETVVPLWLIL